MPDEIYHSIASDAKGIERRQVVNLAKHSTIFNDEGELRTYNDFKQDWVYEKSVFGHAMGTCTLCGKYPIREQCILLDSARAKTGLPSTIIVGNTCVHRYIEITVDGKILNDDEKTIFLRGNMKKAKHLFNKEKFATEHPDAMSRLGKYSDMANEKSFYAGRLRPRDPALRKLQRAMVKRLTSHGYPGPKLWKQWNEFLLTADERWEEWHEKQKQKEISRNEMIAKNRVRSAKFAEQLAKQRSQFAVDADEFREVIELVNKHLDDWERSAASRAERQIRVKGRHNLTKGMTRLVQSLERRASWENGDLVIHNPLFDNISEWVDHPSFLNGWEANFCKSIRNRLIEGTTLTTKQTEVISRLSSRWVA